MSIQAQLKKFASDPEEPKTDRGFLPNQENAQQMAGVEEMFQDHPVPGQSLTQSPESKLDYEKPPEFTDQREFLDYMFETVADPSRLPDILQSLRLKVPVEDVAQKILSAMVQKGKVNVDMMLLSIEPMIYTLIALATHADIDPVLYPEDDFDEDESRNKMTEKFRLAARELRGETDEEDEDRPITVNDIQAPPVLPQGIMKKTEAAVAAVKGGDANAVS